MVAGPVAYSKEADDFLSTHTRSFVMNLRKDGSPTGHPLTAMYINGVLYYNTYRKSIKMRNIVRDNRVACLVTTDEGKEPFRSLTIRGRAVMIEDPQEALAVYQARAGNAGAAGGQGRDSRATSNTLFQQRLQDGRRVLIRIEPEVVRLW